MGCPAGCGWGAKATWFLLFQKLESNADMKIRAISTVQCRRTDDDDRMVLDEAFWEFSLMEMLIMRNTHLKSQNLKLHCISTHRPVISYWAELSIFFISPFGSLSRTLPLFVCWSQPLLSWSTYSGWCFNKRLPYTPTDRPKLNKEEPLVDTDGERENTDHSYRLVGGRIGSRAGKGGTSFLWMETRTFHITW